jgi:hypothetical protein
MKTALHPHKKDKLRELVRSLPAPYLLTERLITHNTRCGSSFSYYGMKVSKDDACNKASFSPTKPKVNGLP